MDKKIDTISKVSSTAKKTDNPPAAPAEADKKNGKSTETAPVKLEDKASTDTGESKVEVNTDTKEKDKTKAEEEPKAANQAEKTGAPEETSNSGQAAPPNNPTGQDDSPEENKSTPDADTYESLFPEPSVIIDNPPQWIWWLVLLIGSVILGLAGFKLVNNRLDSWLTVNKADKTNATPSASATAITSSTPSGTASSAGSATPSPSSASSTPQATASTAVNKTSLSMRVLNGTTVNGAAATAKSTLEKAGFTVRTIGNASKQNYATSFIYYQAGKQEEARAVESALPSYTFTLEESTLANPDNVLVVIGLK